MMIFVATIVTIYINNTEINKAIIANFNTRIELLNACCSFDEIKVVDDEKLFWSLWLFFSEFSNSPWSSPKS